MNFSERFPTRLFEWWSFGLRFDFWSNFWFKFGSKFWIIISAVLRFSTRKRLFWFIFSKSWPVCGKCVILNCLAWNLSKYSAWSAGNPRSDHKNQSFAWLQIEDWKLLDLFHFDLVQENMTLHFQRICKCFRHLYGYIDVDDGCWRPNVFVTKITEKVANITMSPKTLSPK